MFNLQNLQPPRNVVKDIGWARLMLVTGKKVTRNGWLDVGSYLELRETAVDGTQNVYKVTSHGVSQMWSVTQQDLLAEDYKLL